MRMAVVVGAIQSGANDKQIAALIKFAELLGDAYQTTDDLLDLSEDLHLSQITERARTFALEQGINEARARVSGLIYETKTVLRNEFGTDQPANLLCEVADYVAERKV